MQIFFSIFDFRYSIFDKMFHFSYRYLIGIKSRFLPMQYLSKNVQFFSPNEHKFVVTSDATRYFFC